MSWMTRLGKFGPGILLAAVSIGASHMIMSPVAGAKYGFALLWLVIFTHLFKYYAFEFGPRFAAAERKTLLEGYARVGGPKNWSLYLVLLNTTIEGIAVAGAVMTVTTDANKTIALKKTTRKSPTLGKKPPEGAVILFDGKLTDTTKGGEVTKFGWLHAKAGNAESTKTFKDYILHVEFMPCFSPECRGQSRGNSGCFQANGEEV